LSNEHFGWYADALERHGRHSGAGRVYASQWVIVAEDPERAWAEVGERALYQMNEYGDREVRAGVGSYLTSAA
jgi:alkanesulfonate monooxygenase SsuD/methylene tetrahydromethanopterin reductase-like flavin-dependent oxidoreductase (luciferase family)